jgi:hypothetical protein
MLHEHPLSVSRPLIGTIFPHPPEGRKADYVLTRSDRPRSEDATGTPVFANGLYAIYRMDPSVPGPDLSSRAMVDESADTLE